MRVLYRICPFNNNKSPIFAEDKFKLVSMCLKSFAEAFKGLDIEVIFILDSCPPEYKQLINRTIPFRHGYFEREGMGNLGSFRTQVQLASEIDDYVLLLEDDYLWLPNTGEKILQAVTHFDFMTPQDEFNYYFNEPRHKGRYEIKIVGNHHFREVNSTTLTFATHGSLIKKLQGVIWKHEIWDYPMWQEIRSLGYRIWGPVPTLTAHLVKDILPPTINWEEQWSKYQ